MWHLFAHLLLWRESGERLGVFALGTWSLLRWYFAWQVLFFLVFRDWGKPAPMSFPSLLLVYKVNTLEEGFSPPECTWRGLLAAWHKWEISKLTSTSSKCFCWQPFCREYCGTELWLLSFTSGADLTCVFSRKNNHESVELAPHLVMRNYWTFGPLEAAFFSQLRQSSCGAWRSESSSPDVLCKQAFVSLALLRYSLHIPKPTIGSVDSSVIFQWVCRVAELLRNPVLALFHYPPLQTAPSLFAIKSHCHFQPQETADLLLTIRLPLLDISCTWDRSVCNPLHLVPFT